MAFDPACHAVSECFPPDGQSATSGHFCIVGAGKDKGIQTAEFLFQQPTSPIGQIRAKRVAAYQLGEFIGDVGRGGHLRAHLPENRVNLTLGHLPGRLRPGKPAPYDINDRFSYHYPARLSTNLCTIRILPQFRVAPLPSKKCFGYFSQSFRIAGFVVWCVT
jgi:hypothetical protein